MKRWLLLLVEICLACAAASRATAQPTPHDEQVKPTPEDDPTQDVYRRPELPHSQVIHDSGPPYTQAFYTTGSGSRLEPRVGGLHVTLPENIFSLGFNYRAPFLQPHPADTNAEIKIGRLYYDVTSVSGSLLFSDNVNLSENSRRAGLIGVVRLDGMLFIQLMDNLRFAAKVGFIYLPFRNKIGLAGFTQDSLAGRLFIGDSDHFRAQLAYDLQLGSWDVLLYDQVRATQALFAERFNIFAGEPFDEEDRAGRYVFRSNITGGNGTQLRVNESDNRNRDAFIYANNQVGATVSKVLPTDTRLTVGAYRMDYWYMGGDTSFLPRVREVGFVQLNNEHESMRFKPFASYRIYRSNGGKWDQEARAGIRGPISENIDFSGNVGYFIGGRTDRTKFLAHARITHTLGPQTTHSLEYRRDITSPQQDLEQSYTYHIRQILGPYLNADAFFGYATFEDLDNNMTGSQELRGGVLFSTDATAKTSFRFGAVYHRVHYANAVLGTWDRWSALAQMKHHFTDTLDGVLTYQLTDRNSDVAGDSYYENLFVLTLTKYFR